MYPIGYNAAIKIRSTILAATNFVKWPQNILMQKNNNKK